MEYYLVLYLLIGLIWAMNCLKITFKRKYYITWKTYVAGTPFNWLLWPVSMIMAIKKKMNENNRR